MSDDQPKNDFVAYLAVFTEGDDHLQARLMLDTNRERVVAWVQAKGGAHEPEGPPEAEPKADDKGDQQSPKDEAPALAPAEQQLESVMRAVVEAMSGYRPLVGVGVGMIGAIRSVHLTTKMLPEAEKNLTVVEEVDSVKIYGITSEDSSMTNKWLNEVTQYDQAMTAMPGALLLSLVATFDSYVSDIVRIMLKDKPQRLSEDKTLPVRDLLKMNSFDDVIERIVDDEIHGLMRGSHDDQVRYIEKTFNISIRDTFNEWPAFIEIFERRNLAAHGNLLVNQRYLNVCGAHNYSTKDKIGDKLRIDSSYLSKSTSQLTEFLVLLVFVLWRKNYPSSAEECFGTLNDICFNLIKDERPKLAATLLNFALNKQRASASDRIIKMMIVNHANSLKKSGDTEGATKALDAVDWSALADEFRICVASIRDDAPEFIRLMSIVKQTGQVTKESFRDWPAFDWMREREEVQQKFLELFGEPLIRASAEVSTGPIDGNNAGASEAPSDSGTVH